MQKPFPKGNLRRLAAVALSLLTTGQARAENLTVRSVAVLAAPGQPQIEVKTSSPISPATQVVVGPDRIVIDFPGALPASSLKKLLVHRGGLKAVRTGLFQSQPPITRVVLDVDGPTDYQVVPSGNSIIIKLGRPDQAANQATAAPVAAPPAKIAPVKIAMAAPIPTPAALRAPRQPASSIPALQIVNLVTVAPVATDTAPTLPPRSTLHVAVHSNLLSIRAQDTTLAEVLYEIHRRTGADIAIPAGAEQERVVVDIPSAPGRDAIAALLNGSRFNYIVLGTDSDPGGFRNLLLSLKAGGNSGVFVHTAPPSLGSPPQGMQPIASAPDPGLDQSQMDPAGVAQAGPELEPIPDEAPPAEPETNSDNPRFVPRQQLPIQNIPDAGQVPQ
jgi:hypothetical protein